MHGLNLTVISYNEFFFFARRSKMRESKSIKKFFFVSTLL